MLPGDFVYLCHVADGLIRGHNDSLVVAGVFVGQFSALAVLQPFLVHMVAADAEVPDRRSHASEVLRRVNPDAPVLVVVLNLLLGIPPTCSSILWTHVPCLLMANITIAGNYFSIDSLVLSEAF